MAALAPTGRRAPLAKGPSPRNRLVGSFPVSRSTHYGTAAMEKRQRPDIGGSRAIVNRVSGLCELVNGALTGGDDIAAAIIDRRRPGDERRA